MKDAKYSIDQITSPGQEWFLIHHLEEGAQSIYPVAVWAISSGEVVGLISAKHDEGRLVGPPPGITEYKVKAELSDDQITACMAGKVFKQSISEQLE